MSVSNRVQITAEVDGHRARLEVCGYNDAADAFRVQAVNRGACMGTLEVRDAISARHYGQALLDAGRSFLAFAAAMEQREQVRP
jgi:hypothetical protein